MNALSFSLKEVLHSMITFRYLDSLHLDWINVSIMHESQPIGCYLLQNAYNIAFKSFLTLSMVIEDV